MKVVIYGDSHGGMLYSRKTNPDISWLQLLSKKYELMSFAEGGSSLYFSYSKFVETHMNFDKVIFLITSPRRLYINSEMYKEYCPYQQHIPSIGQAERLVKQYAHVPILNKLYKAICNYYVYVENQEESFNYHKLLRENIPRIRSNDIIVIDLDKFAFANDCDFKYYNKNLDEVYSKYVDLRHCHFSQEKHIILANLLEHALDNNLSSIDYSQLLNIKPNKSFEDYFIPLDSIPFVPIISFYEHINESN